MSWKSVSAAQAKECYDWLSRIQNYPLSLGLNQPRDFYYRKFPDSLGIVFRYVI